MSVCYCSDLIASHCIGACIECLSVTLEVSDTFLCISAKVWRPSLNFAPIWNYMPTPTDFDSRIKFKFLVTVGILKNTSLKGNEIFRFFLESLQGSEFKVHEKNYRKRFSAHACCVGTSVYLLPEVGRSYSEGRSQHTVPYYRKCQFYILYQ